jgi:hypothetical protein
MRHLSLLLAVVFSSPLALIAQNPEPIRLCVTVLMNRSHSAVTPEWQQKELIRALERTNAKKEVKKGAAARITAIAIDSTTGPDPTLQEKDGCNFVLNTELVDVQPVGSGRVGTSVPGTVGSGVTIGKVDEPPDMRRLLHDATVNFRIMRVGEPHSWSSGIVTQRDTVTEDALVSRLMNQIASRAANDLRNPHPSTE